MNLPSLDHIFSQTLVSLKRFPLVLTSATVATLLSIYITDLTRAQLQGVEYLYNIILVSVLGIPLFTVGTLLSEKKGWGRMVPRALGVLLLVLYYFILPNNLDEAPTLHIYRLLLFFIGIHLMVSIGPYWRAGEINGFWQYNKALFLRFLTAVFYSGVLFAGLSIALLSINVLLSIEIISERYFQLFFLIGGLFNTWFFIAGIPTSIAQLDDVTEYPKGLKIFTQNILLPLVVVYLVILYLYTGKILLEWTWPEGWVANLVLSFSITGILALLLLHLIRKNVENQWIKQFSRGYFWALIPLVILLLLAIWIRIEEYGVTVNRYFVVILGLWLAGIVAYFNTSKTKNIKVIPASLGIIAFLISFGPWGAFSVSERSQVDRLQHYLQQNELLKNGAVIKASEPILFEDRKQISSIIRYLNETHGLQSIQPWFAQDFATLRPAASNTDTSVTVSRHDRPEHIATQLLDIDYVHSYEMNQEQEKQLKAQREFYTDRNAPMDLQQADWLIPDLFWSPEQNLQTVTLPNGRTLVIESNSEAPHLHIYTKNRPEAALQVNIIELISELTQQFPTTQYQLSAQDMTVRRSNSSWEVSVYFSRINWRMDGDNLALESASFDIAIR